MQLRVFSAVLQQFTVAALLDDLAFVDHDDAVGVAYGVEAVRDDEHGAALADGFHVVMDDAFGFVVERAGRFVKNQDAGMGDERPGLALIFAGGGGRQDLMGDVFSSGTA